MQVIDIIKVALQNIRSNTLRSILTMLGLMIGIASVIILVGIGNGASQSVASQVQSLGTDILTVSIQAEDTSLSYEQVEALKQLANVKAVAPYKTVTGTISKDTKTSSKSSMIATNAHYLEVTNLTITEGRTISTIDIENKSKVCIIGYDLASTLFGMTNPVGEKLKIDGDTYTVIGLLKEEGSSMGTDIDNLLIIPLTTASFLGTDTSITQMYVKVEEEAKIENTIALIENKIRSDLQISSDDYRVSSQESMLETMQEVNNTLSLLLGGIASISLVVGGIGVMNVMLVSVTERTKEIGIRKALGAKRKDILIQFLMESLVLCLLGGSMGVGIGIGIGVFIQHLGYAFTIQTTVVLLAFGTSAVIGIIFGIFPAYRASNLNPIEALRTE